MAPLTTLLRRAVRTLMFWLVVAVFAVAVVRSFFPVEGFDEVRTGEGPIEVAGSDDGLWVINHGDRTVSLVRPSDSEILFSTEVGVSVAPTLSANDDGAWVIQDRGGTLVRIDAGGDVADRIDVSDTFETGAQDLAAGDGFVWLTALDDGQMARVDTDSGTVVDVVDVGESVGQPQIVGDRLWVNQAGALGGYDAETGEQIDLLVTEHRIHDFVVADDAVWLVADVDNFEATGLVVRLDPDDGSETARLRVADARPSRLALEGDRIYLSAGEGTLIELSTVPLAVVATEQVAVSTKDLQGITVLDDTIWVADGTNGVVHQPVGDLEGSPVEPGDDLVPG